jgi:hypothetical protein
MAHDLAGEHAKHVDKVATIFGPRSSGDRVRVLVEFLYIVSDSSLSERASWALDKKRNPYLQHPDARRRAVAARDLLRAQSRGVLRASLVISRLRPVQTAKSTQVGRNVRSRPRAWRTAVIAHKSEWPMTKVRRDKFRKLCGIGTGKR